MEGYGMTNSSNNEDANNSTSAGRSSSPENNNNTINSVGNYNTGNHGSGYPYGYFNGAVNPPASGYKNISSYNNPASNNASTNNSNTNNNSFANNGSSDSNNNSFVNSGSSDSNNTFANSGSSDSNNTFSEQTIPDQNNGYTYSSQDNFNTTYQNTSENPESNLHDNGDENASADFNNSKESASDNIPPNESNLKHMVDIMKAAFPHLDNETQESASLIIQTTELMNTLQSNKSKERVSAFSFRGQNIDIVALLTSIRNVCYARERQMIDSILNLMNMKSMFETYSALSSMMSSQSDTSGNNSNNSTNSTESDSGFGSGLNPNMMDLLGSMLSPEQKSTFDNISMMFNMMQE